MHVEATLPSALGDRHGEWRAPDTAARRAPDTAARRAPDTAARWAPDTAARWAPDTAARWAPDTAARWAPDTAALAATLAIAVVGLVMAAAAAAAFRRVSVEGESMRPAFHPGDRLLVVRLPRWAPLVAGTVVAAEDPRDPRRLLLKRVAGIESDGRVVLHGDNAAASTDSRGFGPVAREAVWGVARYRYAPPQRAGLLREAADPPRG